MPENKETLIPPIERTETSTRMVDLQSERIVSVPAEVKTWMRKIEEDPTITNNGNQQTNGDNDSIMQPIATTVTKITLPTTKKTFTGGFSQPTDNAWKWLTTFILRIIKKSKGNVKFKEE
ncbi:MAG: hypothetical protein PHX84_01855 [Candidatus Shapirobacteria bacterium]|jgi:hypothetical protein|nr:hypothetical protein [Candidatus Shapirobacteria bacterium]